MQSLQWLEHMSKFLEDILTAYMDTPFIVAEGYDDALLGVDNEVPRLVYSSDSCISIIMDRYDLRYDEALEYFYANVKFRNTGEFSPLFVDDNF